jgi:AcrR family transcriptional regulator
LSKKEKIIETAVRLFADQGFDATTTLQIAREAGVTEPLIFYHFKSKDDLFTHILDIAFQQYFYQLDALNQDTATEFEKIKNIIHLHIKIVAKNPDQAYLAVSACPAKLKDPAHVCATHIKKQQKWMEAYLSECLIKGMATGEFHKVPVAQTAGLLIALLNGLIRQRGLKLENVEGLMEETVAFCRRSLVRG